MSATDESVALHSTLVSDPDLAEIVEMFVDELPEKLAMLSACFARGDLGRLRSLAHQLKGSGGSYGFAPLTESAARLEGTVLKSEPDEAVLAALNELLALGQRVRKGIGG